MNEKILVIYPSSKTMHDSIFYLFDPETGECLASHFCSHALYAPGDLHDNRPERLIEWEEKYKNKPMFPEALERAKRLLENVIVVKGDQIEEILNQTPLETQFEIHLQMSDYENWEKWRIFRGLF